MGRSIMSDLYLSSLLLCVSVTGDVVSSVVVKTSEFKSGPVGSGTALPTEAVKSVTWRDRNRNLFIIYLLIPRHSMSSFKVFKVVLRFLPLGAIIKQR